MPPGSSRLPFAGGMPAVDVRRPHATPLIELTFLHLFASLGRCRVLCRFCKEKRDLGAWLAFSAGRDRHAAGQYALGAAHGCQT